MLLVLACAASAGLIGYQAANGQDKKPAASAAAPPYSGASCFAPVDSFFADEVWAKVGERTCLTCHKPGGDAEDSEFLFSLVAGQPHRVDEFRGRIRKKRYHVRQAARELLSA